ncbi:putative membrane protein (plasmid) [Rhizobium favelukesii]|uniref:Membrane protein n=1 Tax=Rhizobium favelukesii TaxID=348824 RepID=W6S0P2_9HYPH|nr:putative membrane protein [Rhizobium favelukesii]
MNLTAKRVSCVWYEEMNGKPVSPAGILSAIAGCGYQAHLFTADLSDDDRVRNQLLLAVGVSGFAAANIMCFPSRSGPGRRLQRATCSIGYRQ